MKKIFFAAIISLVTVLCVSATVANIPSDDFSSSVSLTLAGSGEDIDFDTKTLVTIYNLSGQIVNKVMVQPMSKERVAMPTAGIYIANSRKVAVL